MMSPDELKKLDEAVAAKRAEREKLMLTAEDCRTKAHKLSAEIREMEGKLPSPKERRGIVMQAEAAKVTLAPRR
jgi:hypothetical protein